jgi:putative membrane protein
MKVLSLAFLIIFLATIGIFAYQNQESINVEFLSWKLTVPLAALAAASYLLGMLSGGSIWGLLRRSIRDLSHRDSSSV